MGPSEGMRWRDWISSDEGIQSGVPVDQLKITFAASRVALLFSRLRDAGAPLAFPVSKRSLLEDPLPPICASIYYNVHICHVVQDAENFKVVMAFTALCRQVRERGWGLRPRNPLGLA